MLLLHGGPGLSDYTAPLTAELDDAFTVIRFQQRGLEPSITSGPFGIGRHVADGIAVLDAAGAGQAYVIGHSWGGHLAMHLAARHQDRLLGLVAVDPLGAVPDGGASDLDRILAERVPPELAARAQELDQRAMAGEGTAGDALEGLAIVWPGYFSSPGKAPPMPPLSLSLECYAGTFASIHAHFERKTLERSPALAHDPGRLLAGRGQPDPAPARRGLSRAHPRRPSDDRRRCGHFLWLERPGSVRRALQSICS